jgi:hypothetical protein
MNILKKGFKFKISGMPDIYEIIDFKNNIFQIKMDGLNRDYPVDKKDLEDMLNTGALEPLEEKEVTQTSSNQDGMFCSNCKNFFPYAQPNQPDNKTLICYSCRNFP